MQKISITQHELNAGAGRFHDYMTFVVQRLLAKPSDPKLVLFAAADIIASDGLDIIVGSNVDDAGASVANWLSNFYGDRQNISYCFPALAIQLNGIAYLLRFPIIRNSTMTFTEAVIDLSDQALNYASTKTLALLQHTYNEFYNALYLISRFDTTTVTHLEASAHHIYHGAAHYALARWDALFFIERAMKEVLLQTKTAVPTGSPGHDVRGALHDAWIEADKPALPLEMLDAVMCPTSIRYEKTPQPFIATVRAHHAAVKLGALIARELPAPPVMEGEFSMKIKTISRDPVLALARIMQSIDPSFVNAPYVQLLRPSDK